MLNKTTLTIGGLFLLLGLLSLPPVRAQEASWAETMKAALAAFQSEDYAKCSELSEAACMTSEAHHNKFIRAAGVHLLMLSEVAQLNYERFYASMKATTELYRVGGTEHLLQLANCLYDTSRVRAYNRRFKEAVEGLMEALPIYQKLKDERAQASCFYNLGILYDRLDRLDDSKASFSKAHEIYERLNEEDSVADCFYNLALISVKLKDFNTASVLIDKSESLRQTKLPPQLEIPKLYHKSRIAFELGNYENAERMARQVVQDCDRQYQIEMQSPSSRDTVRWKLATIELGAPDLFRLSRSNATVEHYSALGSSKGPNDVLKVKAIDLLSEILHKENRIDEANDMRKQAESIRTELTQFVRQVQGMMQSKWRPPPEFESYKVKVEFKILPNGKVAFAEVVQSGNRRKRDASALKAVTSVDTVPLPPQSAAGAEVDMEMTFDYKVLGDQFGGVRQF